MPLEILRREQKGVTIVTVRGKAALGIGDNAIHAGIKDLLARGTRTIVVDLEKATSIDSSGIGELVSATVSALKEECVIVFSSLPAKVLKVLEMTGLLRCMVHYPTLDHALAAVRGLTFEAFREVQCFRPEGS